MLGLGLGALGFTVHKVEPGTVVEGWGKKLTVTDERAVRRGSHIYLTAKAYDALIAKAEEINQ